MKIGIDGNEANVGNRVGSNVFAYKILSFLQRQTQSKVSYEIFLKNKPLSDMPQEKSNWQYQVLKPTFFWTRWRLPLSLVRHKDTLDCFFTPGHYSPGFCPLPLVISIMDLAFLRYPSQFRKKDLLQLTNWTKASVSKASHILTISQFSKKEIIHFYGFPKDKITVVYPGKEEGVEELFSSSQDWLKVKSRYKLDKYLICIGTLQPRKNLNRLFKAFLKLAAQKEFKDLKLVVVGKKGWLFEEILKKGKSLRKKIVFTGFVSKKDKFLLLKHAQSLVLPSLYEGFGIPVLEAMQVGCPVIVSKTSSLPEVAGKAGIYINDPYSPDDICQTMLKMLKLTQAAKKKLIKIGLTRSRQFSWTKAADQTLEVLLKTGGLK